MSLDITVELENKLLSDQFDKAYRTLNKKTNRRIPTRVVYGRILSIAELNRIKIMEEQGEYQE